MRVEFSERGICCLEFRRSGVPAATGSFARQLKAYTAGKPIRFTIPVDLTAGTAFQQAVWRVLLKIPRGETRSYGWVAKQIGKPRATRAVGSACGANPVPIIVPCHRVIAGDGSIGGFGCGLPLKKKLLALEGVKL
ncbi:MAG: methylated-DNA--[protein]-cysteine S-methyltransferase [Verrucomicrobiota bacterium]